MGLIIADSIALRLLDHDALAVGVGNELHLHNLNTTNKVVTNLRGKVHGIVKNGNKLLVYGEKEFKLLHFTHQYEFKLLCQGVFTDWISSGKFLEDDNASVVLLTSHSVLLRCDIATGNIKEKYSCTDKSTLYCSHMHGDEWDSLVIFGGNAFGELLIWRPPPVPIDNKINLLHRIQAHNGVIFSIDYNDDLNVLTTTSDDRSIKFWTVSRKSPTDWADANILHLASGFGHVARVFQNKIIRYGSESYAVTVGEDSYFCLWRCNGELAYKRREHFGATIWNVEYDEITKTLFTVGSTGNLRAFNLSDAIQDAIDPFKLLPIAPNGSYVAKVKFLNENMLIGMTSEHCMVYSHLDAPHWLKVFPEGTCNPRKCTVLEVNENLIACCSYKHLSLIEYETNERHFRVLYDGQLLNGVIRAFQFLKGDYFLVSDETGACLLLTKDLCQQFTIELPKCKEPWITAALMIDDEYLLVSNRLGNFLLYKCHNSKFELHAILRQPHGRLGATVFKLVESSSERILVHTAGHDCSLKILTIERSTGEFAIHSREVIPIHWVEYIDCEQSDGVPLLIGFNEDHFVIWSKQHDFICQVSCGGGHRCWHYTLWNDPLTNILWLLVVFIKNRRVRLHRLKLFNDLHCNIPLAAPNMWHTKVCNVATVMRIHNDNEINDYTLLITAGDDNLIKIFRYWSANERILLKTEIHTHISSVRTLKVHRIDTEHCLIFSAGGRAQLCISKLHLRRFHVHHLCTHTIKPKSGSPKRDNSSSSNIYNINPETRIISLDIQPLNSYNYKIFLGCSDGYVRKMNWNINNLPETQVELFYGQCVLQVRLLLPQFTAVAGTDGCIRLYDMELNNTHLALQHHASGVNALDVLLCTKSPSRCHVLSGGDDQSVVYSLVDLAKLEILRNVCLSWLHTAQVTAVRLRFEGNHILAYTSGVDQKLCIVDLETEKLCNEFLSCVADVKGLCIDNTKRCFTYGSGMQVHKFTMCSQYS